MYSKYSKLINYLKQRIPINDDEIATILNHFTYGKVKKNENLLFKGNISNFIYFVNQGVLRTFYLTKFGNESTRIIAPEGNFCGSLSSFIQQTPSFEFIEALEDSEILYISKTDFDNLLLQSNAIEKVYRKILEEVQIFNMWRIESFISMGAQERYLFLFKKHPEIINCVSNKILASYLAIKPETLSRIKTNLSKK